LEFVELVLAILDIVAKPDRRRSSSVPRASAPLPRPRASIRPQAELVAHRQREARECLRAGGTQRKFALSYNASQATIRAST